MVQRRAGPLGAAPPRDRGQLRGRAGGGAGRVRAGERGGGAALLLRGEAAEADAGEEGGGGEEFCVGEAGGGVGGGDV